MKKLLSLMLAVVMSLSMMGTTFAAEMDFTDVNMDDWFYNDVKTAVEMGLVNGKSATTYAPNDNLTYAEAIKLAACMNQIYNEGVVSFASGSPWYKPYVDYCMDNGIIDKEYNYDDFVTRAGYMGIFANALPEEGLKEINNVPDDSIPDVASSKAYAAGVYKLYRAGILQGVDEKHNCNPLANITRAEVAAILTRMMNESKRVEFSMGKEETKPEVIEELAIKVQPVDASVKVGEKAIFEVEVEGGVEPYEYNWQTNRDGGDFYDINKNTFNEHEGLETAVYTVTISQTVLDNKQGFRCVITDADGTSVTSEAALVLKKDEATGGAKDNFEQVETVENKNEDFKMTVESLVVVTDRGIILTGRVAEGKVNTNDKVYINDADGKHVATTTVKGIEMFKKLLDEAEKGDNIGLWVDLDVDTYRDAIPAGYVVSASKGAVSVGTRPSTGMHRPLATALKISTQPTSASAALGDTVPFKVAVTGGEAPYEYQWYTVATIAGKKTNVALENSGATIGGVTTDTLSLRPNQAGKTEVYCVVTDAKGNTVKSDVVSIEVIASEGGRQTLPSGKSDYTE